MLVISLRELLEPSVDMACDGTERRLAAMMAIQGLQRRKETDCDNAHNR